jgi:uncharacterized protein (TIGR02265 family)
VTTAQTLTLRLDEVLDVPLDVDRHIADLPEQSTVKGYVANVYYDHVAAARPEAVAEYARLYPGRLTPVEDLPSRLFARRLVDAARLAHPDLPLSEGIRRVGWTIYPNLISSLLGRAVLLGQGNNFQGVAAQGPQAYEAFEKGGSRVTYTSLGERRFRYDYDPGRTFLGQYHVGIIEGAAIALGHTPTLAIRLRDESHGSIECSW